ncbi:MAG: hypothetical protein ACKPJJ_08510 [Planctomycetaceae bacterium]
MDRQATDGLSQIPGDTAEILAFQGKRTSQHSQFGKGNVVTKSNHKEQTAQRSNRLTATTKSEPSRNALSASSAPAVKNMKQELQKTKNVHLTQNRPRENPATNQLETGNYPDNPTSYIGKTNTKYRFIHHSIP